MKLPFPTQTTNKPLTSSIPPATAESESVLDLRRSPPSGKPADPLADHVLINQHLVDWDSLMRELGLHDDSTPLDEPTPDHHDSNSVINSFDPPDLGLLPDIPTYSMPHVNPHSINATNSFHVIDLDCVDELIRLAECFDTDSVQLGHVILARLNQRLTSPVGKPLRRAAFYYKEALQSQLTGSAHQPATSSEIVQTIIAQNTFSRVSPIPLFSNFTSNQALLDSLDGSAPANVHVIDFDIGLGSHWASLVQELADQKSGFAAPAIRITALVPEEYANESRLIRENLTAFAEEMNIRFEIEFVSIRSFEYLSVKAVRFAEGESVAVILSPAIFRQVGTGFLGDLRHVSPHVVVHVDTGSTATSCRQAVIDGLEFHSTLLETLEVANFNCSDGDDWMRRIERFVVYPKIVEAAGQQGTRCWREALVAAGLKQVEPSQFAEFQAECLLRKVQVRGFHVARRQTELVLCWHDRPIVATSSWRY